VHRARLMGRVEPTTGIAPFAALADQVMTSEPYASARRVFWVADNGSSHRGQASIDRMAAAWPNAVLVHLPVHASWLNQVEVVFSVIQRKVIKPSDIGDAAALAARLLAFQDRYNTTARPFDWKFTRAGLNDLCRRIDARRSHGTVALAA
jgi:DDE superfamily endonuclease